MLNKFYKNVLCLLGKRDLVFFNPFYSPFKFVIGNKMSIQTSTFAFFCLHPLQLVGHGSETQLQVGENLII